MTDLFYMALGALVTLGLQVAAYGAREMRDHDASEESWKSIMQLETDEGR